MIFTRRKTFSYRLHMRVLLSAQNTDRFEGFYVKILLSYLFYLGKRKM